MTKESDKAYRKLSRQIAVSIIEEMLKNDFSIQDISDRIGISIIDLSSRLLMLINGEKFKESLDTVSDVFLAMGAELNWNIVKNTPK